MHDILEERNKKEANRHLPPHLTPSLAFSLPIWEVNDVRAPIARLPMLSNIPVAPGFRPRRKSHGPPAFDTWRDYHPETLGIMIRQTYY
jgi:hypothetical protein